MTGPPTKYVEDPLIWPETIEARQYQKNISEKTIQKNTMVILPTALGKTVISALAATWFLHNHWDMKILVMAPTRPLVLQHKKTFSKLLRIREEKVTVLTGKVPPSYRRHLWSGDAKIYFATPQVVSNDLASESLSLESFSFVVFDECHRARKNYAYNLVAEKYVEQASWPILIATTASPGSNEKDIQETCRDLRIEQIEFRTESDPDVTPYINKIEVQWKRVGLPGEYKEMAAILRNILWKRLRKIQSLGLVKKHLKYITRRDLLQAGGRLRRLLEETSETERGSIYGAIVLQAASLTTFHALELLETQGTYSFGRFLKRVERQSCEKKSYRNVMLDSEYPMLRSLLSRYHHFNHPKIDALKAELSSHLRHNSSTRVLIFTQYRDTATHIVEEVKGMTGVNAKRFVGQASKENDPGLSQNEQTKILNDFRKGTLNVLVATSIAEEGLDIPAVDLVIFYEPIPSEIRYIQRRGRTGRKSFGKTIILATNDTSDIAYLYASQRKVEKMKKIVANLNKQLKTIKRNALPPTPRLMPKTEIAEEKTYINTQKDTERFEKEGAKRFAKEVNKAARRLWLKAIKAGAKGLLIENLLQEMISEGHSPKIFRAAVEHLEKADKIHKLDGDRIASVENMQAPKEKKDKHVYEVEIERVLTRRAVCLINNKWRAELTPEEYEGPQNLIKKNTRFKARCALYCEGKNLCIRVQRVTEIIQACS
jgi:Fanconi anemia group M protein